MEQFNTNDYGVVELNNDDMQEIDGGCPWVFVFGLVLGLMIGLMLASAAKASPKDAN